MRSTTEIVVRELMWWDVSTTTRTTTCEKTLFLNVQLPLRWVLTIGIPEPQNIKEFLRNSVSVQNRREGGNLDAFCTFVEVPQKHCSAQLWREKDYEKHPPEFMTEERSVRLEIHPPKSWEKKKCNRTWEYKDRNPEIRHVGPSECTSCCHLGKNIINSRSNFFNFKKAVVIWFYHVFFQRTPKTSVRLSERLALDFSYFVQRACPVMPHVQ